MVKAKSKMSVTDVELYGYGRPRAMHAVACAKKDKTYARELCLWKIINLNT